jgi:voltage-gated potassium channel
MLRGAMPFTIVRLLNRIGRSPTGRLVAGGVACVLIGAALFSITQHISYGTGVYWALTTATTVGYGDVTPKNSVGRVVAIGVMVTTIPLFASAFATFAGAVAAAHFHRLTDVADRDTTDREVVIFGLHPAVPRIAQELIRAGREVVVVADTDPSRLPAEVRLISGDPTAEEVVRRSQPERANQLLVTGADDADALVTALLVRERAPGVPTLAIAHSASVSAALKELGIAIPVATNELLANTLAKSLEAPHAAELMLRLVDSQGLQLKELPVEGPALGRRLSDVRGERAGLVLGAVHEDRVMFGVDEDPVLAEGDRLLSLEPDRS